MYAFRFALAVLLVGMAGISLIAADRPSQAATSTSADGPSLAKPKGSKAAQTKLPAAKPAPALSADREAVALAFAREHHPELAQLIEKLHQDNRRQYDRALRELSQSSERLLRLKKQSAEQYELGLAAWKLDSRAKLLAARMTMAPTAGLEAELRQVLSERADVRLKEYQSERARLEDRVKKLNASIRSLETSKAAIVEKDFLRIKQSVARSRRPPAKRPTIKPRAAGVEPTVRPVVAERPQPASNPTAASVAPPASPRGTKNSNE